MSLGDVFETILAVGDATGYRQNAYEYVAVLKSRVEGVRQRRQNSRENTRHRPSVAFLEWIDPPFNAGHWTPELIEIAGGIDCLGEKHQPSRTISFDDIATADAEVLVIAQCGFDLERSTQDLDILKRNLPWNELKAVRNNRVHIVDGNAYFSRSGPRLVDSLLIMEQLLWGQNSL
jgi:iron complex transport system substrate-binding protein